MRTDRPGNPGKTRAAYAQEAAQFRAFLRAESTKPRDQQRFPESEDDWVGVVATVTCHTEGCPARGVPDTRRFLENPRGVEAACGSCEQPPRLTATFDDGDHEIPNTYTTPKDAPAGPPQEQSPDSPPEVADAQH